MAKSTSPPRRARLTWLLNVWASFVLGQAVFLAVIYHEATFGGRSIHVELAGDVAIGVLLGGGGIWRATRQSPNAGLGAGEVQ